MPPCVGAAGECNFVTFFAYKIRRPFAVQSVQPTLELSIGKEDIVICGGGAVALKCHVTAKPSKLFYSFSPKEVCHSMWALDRTSLTVIFLIGVGVM